MSGFFSALLEKQHQRFSIEGVWDMKRKILLLTLICAIIVFSILFFCPRLYDTTRPRRFFLRNGF